MDPRGVKQNIRIDRSPKIGVKMFQFTVSENAVVCCSDPEVAVTMIVEVTGIASRLVPFQ